MPNKLIISFIIFFLICVSIFANTETESFIEDYYWYRKYLPQENISEYYTLKDALIYLKENDDKAFENLSSNLSEPIRYLNNRVHRSLQRERDSVNPKIKLLKERYSSNKEIILLAEQFAQFEDALSERIFPIDDSCLSKIDELYSRLITRLGYVFPNDGDSNDRRYLVVKGDYLRKIALKFYGNELLWKPIYYENKDDRSFLPNPQNPDLIYFYPEVKIRIPPKPE